MKTMTRAETTLKIFKEQLAQYKQDTESIISHAEKMKQSTPLNIQAQINWPDANNITVPTLQQFSQ